MPQLSWITDKALDSAVFHLLSKSKEAKSEAEINFGKNVIDPFSALFEMSGFEINYEAWIKSETNRQAQKTLQNHIGDFHQKILGSISGWDNMKTGKEVDLYSESNKIIAEVKNKYNTLSGGKLADLYSSLEKLVMPKSSIYKGFTAYYVAIIPKSSIRYDREFTPSDKSRGEKCASNKLIREIDGSSFYSLATGEDRALENLFNVLPNVIEKCSNGKFVIENPEKLKVFFNLAFS